MCRCSRIHRWREVGGCGSRAARGTGRMLGALSCPVRVRARSSPFAGRTRRRAARRPPPSPRSSCALEVPQLVLTPMVIRPVCGRGGEAESKGVLVANLMQCCVSHPGVAPVPCTRGARPAAVDPRLRLRRVRLLSQQAGQPGLAVPRRCRTCPWGARRPPTRRGVPREAEDVFRGLSQHHQVPRRQPHECAASSRTLAPGLLAQLPATLAERS